MSRIVSTASLSLAILLGMLTCDRSCWGKESFQELLARQTEAYEVGVNNVSVEGSITVHRWLKEDQSPTVLCKAQFRMEIKDHDHFRIEYDIDALTDVRTYAPLEDRSRILVSDGNKLYLKRTDAAGVATCYVFGSRWKGYQLRELFLPQTHPLHLWATACRYVTDDDLSFSWTNLNREGVWGQGKGAHWSADYYLFPADPLQLKRVAIRSSGAVTTEHVLSWSDEGRLVGSVSRFVGRHHPGSKLKELRNEVSIGSIADQAKGKGWQFGPQSLDVVDGTVFRETVPVPRRYQLVGNELEPLTDGN